MNITNNIRRACFSLILSLFFLNLSAQVTSVKYQLKYNSSLNVYEAYLHISSGSAITVPDRIQLNAQYSIVAPTGSTITIDNNFMPLEANENYNSVVPAGWRISTTVLSPLAQPESDFYGITPSLSPTSHYNDLSTGDTIKLFSFSIDNTTECSLPIRIYENGVDPSSNEAGMQSHDFSNGFTMGVSFIQIYNDNLPPENIPTTLPALVVTITGDTEININETTSLSPTSGGIWTSNNPSIASIDDLGIVTGISPGQATFTFTDNNSGCSTTSDTITVLFPDSSFDIDKNSDFIISPNPINQQLNITSINTKNKPILITIYNINGRKVFNSQQILKEGKHEISIDFKGYPKGLYLIHILSENGSESLKFIKKNK